MTDEQRKQFIEEQIEIFPADCEMGEFLRDMAKLQSCTDAISRSDAIRVASGYCHWTNIPDELAKLPSVSTEKTGKWIPVSERLPEDGIYLVTVERIAGEPRIETKSFAKDLHRVDDYDFPKHRCGWYDYDSEYGYWEDTNVIAWMPLPQPYEPQESEE